MKYVLTYESADGVRERAMQHFAEHRATWQRYVDSGELLMIGPFADAQTDGSMAVFRTREAAEEFAANDPFVVHGVVKGWRIREWNEALVP